MKNQQPRLSIYHIRVPVPSTETDIERKPQLPIFLCANMNHLPFETWTGIGQFMPVRDVVPASQTQYFGLERGRHIAIEEGCDLCRLVSDLAPILSRADEQKTAQMEVQLRQHVENIALHKEHTVFIRIEPFGKPFGRLCKVSAHSSEKTRSEGTREKVITKEQVSPKDLERTLYECIWNTHYDNSNRAWTVDLQCVGSIKIGMSVRSTNPTTGSPNWRKSPEDREQSEAMVRLAEPVVRRFLAQHWDDWEGQEESTILFQPDGTDGLGLGGPSIVFTRYPNPHRLRPRSISNPKCEFGGSLNKYRGRDWGRQQQASEAGLKGKGYLIEYKARPNTNRQVHF